MGSIVLLWLCIFSLVDLEFLNYIRPHPRSVLSTLGCATAAACCGTLTQIFLKVVSMVVREAIQFDPSILTRELVPLIIAASLLALTAVLQLYLINATMSTGKVIIAVPSYSSLTIVLTITGGAVFYGDFDSLTPGSMLNFGVGVSIVAVGILLLSVLQWCRNMRQRKFLKEGGVREPLHSESRGRKGGAPSALSHESPPSADSITLDGASSYGGDGASTYGDGASTVGDRRDRDSDADDLESQQSAPASAPRRHSYKPASARKGREKHVPRR